jgi:hypothetical protein
MNRTSRIKECIAMTLSRYSGLFCFALAAICLSACAAPPASIAKYPSASRDDLPEGDQNNIYARPDSIFGPRGVIGFIQDTLGTSGQ